MITHITVQLETQNSEAFQKEIFEIIFYVQTLASFQNFLLYSVVPYTDIPKW